MDFFKRLASQNQERKFNVMWKRLDKLAAKHGGTMLIHHIPDHSQIGSVTCQSRNGLSCMIQKADAMES